MADAAYTSDALAGDRSGLHYPDKLIRKGKPNDRYGRAISSGDGEIRTDI